jgi:hypothetical protein
MAISQPIRFTCPTCSATHGRGFLDGVSVFRCLRCGYLGHGFHSVAEATAIERYGTDAALSQASDAAAVCKALATELDAERAKVAALEAQIQDLQDDNKLLAKTADT